MRVPSMPPRVALAAFLLLAFAGIAEAASPACRALEAQLSSLQKKSSRAAAFDGAASQQRAAIASAEGQARRAGCFGGGLFVRDQSGSSQCRALVSSIGKMKANLAKLDRGSRVSGGGSGASREAILRQLGANNCGPQYASYVAQPQQRGFLQRLFNPDPLPRQTDVAVVPARPVTRDTARRQDYDGSSGYDLGFGGGTYRTLCVRTCDGYYFPISYTTRAGNFQTDQQVCQQMCPGTEVVLYAHRNPGQDSTRALSTVDKSPYADLPNAFAYRSSYNSGCTCGKSSALDIVAGGYSPAAIGPYSAALAPVPGARPEQGEDPETLANRRGQFDPGEIGKPNIATPVASLTTPVPTVTSGGPVRRVGPSYYYAQ